MSEHKFFYPDDWAAISRFIRDANGWTCQECQRQCRRPGEKYLGWERELTIAHYFQEYSSPEVFVACLCVKCHLAHDAPYTWLSRWRWERWRRARAGQMVMFAQ